MSNIRMKRHVMMMMLRWRLYPMPPTRISVQSNKWWKSCQRSDLGWRGRSLRNPSPRASGLGHRNATPYRGTDRPLAGNLPNTPTEIYIHTMRRTLSSLNIQINSVHINYLSCELIFEKSKFSTQPLKTHSTEHSTHQQQQQQRA